MTSSTAYQLIEILLLSNYRIIGRNTHIIDKSAIKRGLEEQQNKKKDLGGGGREGDFA